jgi:hypothetical protein
MQYRLEIGPTRGCPGGATWAPWAERLVPFSLEVNDFSETPLMIYEEYCKMV